MTKAPDFYKTFNGFESAFNFADRANRADICLIIKAENYADFTSEEVQSQELELYLFEGTEKEKPEAGSAKPTYIKSNAEAFKVIAKTTQREATSAL